MLAFTREQIAPPTADSNRYTVPSAGRRVALESSIVSFLAGDIASATAWAISAEYLLCRGTEEQSDLVLWRPPAGEGQARIVLRAGPARPLIFEAPHPFYDSGTLEQAAYLFDRLDARVLIVSGTHRCANEESSGCNGTTTACGGTGPFRISDMAHTEESLFHTAHRTFAEHFGSDWVVGLHGMGAGGASVSDGTKDPTSATSPAAKVASALAARFDGVSTCNSYSGGVPVDSHLCGTTDVQGRHLNGVSNACTQEAGAASQRFVHLEQSRAVRGALSEVAAAFESVAPPVGP